MLLEAFTRCRPTTRLWIASDGPDGCATAPQYAGDKRIAWLGRISDPEKFARLRGASVFCAPSLHGESFGVVLIEAMAAGTPVVASGLDGYRNVATDGVDALLVEPGDVGAPTKDALTTCSSTPARRVAAPAGRAAGRTSPWRTLAEEYVRIYRQLLDGRAGTPPGAAPAPAGRVASAPVHSRHDRRSSSSSPSWWCSW